MESVVIVEVHDEKEKEVGKSEIDDGGLNDEAYNMINAPQFLDFSQLDIDDDDEADRFFDTHKEEDDYFVPADSLSPTIHLLRLSNGTEASEKQVSTSVNNNNISEDTNESEKENDYDIVVKTPMRTESDFSTPKGNMNSEGSNQLIEAKQADDVNPDIMNGEVYGVVAMDSPLPNNTFEVKAVIDNCQTDSSKAADAYQKNDGANEVLPNGMDEVDGPVPNSCSTEDTDQKNELPDGMNEIDGHLPETENCNTEDADQKNDGTNEVVPDGMNEVYGPVPESLNTVDEYQKNDGTNEVVPDGMNEVDGPVTDSCNTAEADQKNDGTNEVVPDGMNEVDGPVPDENREAETLANGGEQEKPSAELTEPELAGSGTEKMVKPNIALPKRTGLKMTLPKPFKLHQTRSRTNLVNENEGSSTHNFKAKPVPMKVLYPPPVILRKCDKVTKPRAMHFASDDRIRERQEKKASVESLCNLVAEGENKVKSSSTSLVKIPPTPKRVVHSNSTTKVKPFSFEERNKEMLLKKEQRIQEKMKEERVEYKFQANPAPTFASKKVRDDKVQTTTSKKMQGSAHSAASHDIHKTLETTRKIGADVKGTKLQSNKTSQGVAPPKDLALKSNTVLKNYAKPTTNSKFSSLKKQVINKNGLAEDSAE